MPWITFGTQTSPEPMSKLDSQFGNVAKWSDVDCSVAGTNDLTLTPTLTGYTVPAYSTLVKYSFIAINDSTGAVTVQIAALSALNAYKSDGVTQIGAGDILADRAYIVTFNAALNSAAGGWYLTPIGTQSGTVSNPVTLGQGGTGQTTAASARASAGLDIDQMTSTSANASYTILATDRTVVSTSTAMTGGHTWTLPAAADVNPGQQIDVCDLSGVVGAQTLTISRAGSDTINGTTSVALATQYGGWRFKSDGTSKWTASYLPPSGTSGASGGLTTSGGNIVIDTNNVLGVGAYALLMNQTGSTLNSGSTAAGAALLIAFGSAGAWAATGIPAGTWRNVSGHNLTYTGANDGEIGLMIRTA